MDTTKSMIEKLEKISDAWKAQWQPPYDEYWGDDYFQVKPDLPLKWHVEDGILFLDDVWIAPAATVKADELDEAPKWVNPMTIQLALIGSQTSPFVGAVKLTIFFLPSGR